MAVLLARVSSSPAQGQLNAQNLVTDLHNAVKFVISSEARWQELMDDGKRLCEQHRFEDAEHEFQSAVGISEEFGHDMATTLFNYSELLRKVHRKTEARKLTNRASLITSQDSRDRPMQYTIDYQDIHK